MPNRYCPQHSYKIYRQKIPNRTRNWKQKRIVKLTSESFKEMVYRKHKEKQKKQVTGLKWKNRSVRDGIMFQLSLTGRWRKLPEVANEWKVCECWPDEICICRNAQKKETHAEILCTAWSYKFTQKMTLQAYFLSWAVNISGSTKSIPVVITDDYSYASLGFLVFTVQFEKNFGIIYMWSQKWCLVRCLRLDFFVMSYLSKYWAVSWWTLI